MTKINTLLVNSSSNTSGERLRIAYILISYIILGVVIAILVWSSFRGLDITDESFYLVGYIQGIEPVFSYSQFHKIYNTFLGYLNFSIVEIRLFRIAVSIISSLFFAHALFIYLQKTKVVRGLAADYHLLAISVMTGSLMGYTWLPQTLSYNIFSFIFFQLILTFYFYAQYSTSLIYKVLFKLLTGFFLAASFYNKFPNFIFCISVLFLFSILMPENKSLKKTFYSLGISFFLYSIGFAIFSLILFQENIISEGSKLASMIQSSGEQSSFDYKSIYLEDFKNVWGRTYPYITIIILFGFSYFVILQKHKQSALLKITESLPILFLLIFIVINSSYLGGVSRKYLHFDFYLISTLLFLVILLVHKDLLKEHFNKVVIISLFLLSFLLGALGTNNGLSAQFMIYISFLMAALSVIAIAIRKFTLIILLAIVALTATAQIVTGILLDPYREAHGINAQKYEVTNLAGFNNLKLDSATYDLINKLRGVKNLRAKHLFIYSHQTGIALITEKTPYGFGWYSPSNPSFCVKLIENAPFVDEKDIIFIIPQKIEMHSDLKNALKLRNIYFPENYKLYDQILFEDCQKGDNILLDVYTYKDISKK